MTILVYPGVYRQWATISYGVTLVYFKTCSFKMNARKKSSLHSEGCCSNLAEEFAESSNFSFQESGFFFSAPRCFSSVTWSAFVRWAFFHIRLLEQQIRSCALFKRERGESHSVRHVSHSHATHQLSLPIPPHAFRLVWGSSWIGDMLDAMTGFVLLAWERKLTNYVVEKI